MSKLSREEIGHLAVLARLSLLPGEVEQLNKDLGAILKFVEEISTLTLEWQTQPSLFTLKDLREDKEGSDKLTISQLKEIAPSMEGRYLVAPAVFDDESST